MPVIFNADNISPVTASRVPAVKTFNLEPKEGLFSAFMVRPEKVHFVSQESGEEILLFLRRHQVTNLGWILFSAFLIILPPFIFPLFNFSVIFPFEVPPAYSIVFGVFWYVAIFAFMFVNFLLWYFNVNIVTKDRVIDIDYHYLLVQNEASTKVSQIEDISYKRVGVMSTLFNYGDVLVQTAGTQQNIEFSRIPDPERVSRLILELIGT